MAPYYITFPDIQHSVSWRPSPTGSHFYDFSSQGDFRLADRFYFPWDSARETVNVTFIAPTAKASSGGDDTETRYGSKLVVILNIGEGTERRDILHRIPEYRIVDFHLVEPMVGPKTALAYFATESEALAFAARFQDAGVCAYRLGDGVRGPAFVAPSTTRPYSGDIACAIECSLPRTINWGVPVTLASDVFELLRVLGLDGHVVDAWAPSANGGIFIEFDSPGRVWKLNREMTARSLRHRLFPEELKRFYRNIRVFKPGDADFAALSLRDRRRDELLDVYALFKKGQLEEIRHWGTPSIDYSALYDELWEQSNHLPLLPEPRDGGGDGLLPGPPTPAPAGGPEATATASTNPPPSPHHPAPGAAKARDAAVPDRHARASDYTTGKMRNMATEIFQHSLVDGGGGGGNDDEAGWEHGRADHLRYALFS